MRKKLWTDRQMTMAAFVDPSEAVEQAAFWSRELTRMKARGPGDTENAMRVIEREYGIDYWVLWRLRYRRGAIKDIYHSIFTRLAAAYQAERERQMRLLRHDLERTKEATGPDDHLVLAIEARIQTPTEADGE